MVTLTEKMRQVLGDFLPTLHSWMSGMEHRMREPFETEYSENYAPANAAVIFASVYHHRRDTESWTAAHQMIRRSVTLLQDREKVSPFCRVFLLHYSLLAILFLPKKDRTRIHTDVQAVYATYEDDCGQINTNCAALQWGTELFIDALGYRSANCSYMQKLLHFIQSGQNEQGFINDDRSPAEDRDGMPIAYHVFILFILTTALIAVENWREPLLKQRMTAESIVQKGWEWLRQAVTPDGTFAMIERSRYQMFTWGAFIAVNSYLCPQDTFFLERAFDVWLPYRKADGSYSCTPNALPHELRTGFERYTHVNMYNNLGLTGIAVAERIRSRGIQLLSHCDLSVPSTNGLFVDSQSGYVFVRKKKDFFGCTLRVHGQRYAPAMQGFHFRLDGEALPIPEATLYEATQHDRTDGLGGVWEGYLLRDEEGERYYPDVTENVHLTEANQGIKMEFNNHVVHCKKWLTFLQQGIEWRYILTPKRAFTSCEHIFPILVYDGKHGIRIIDHDRHRIVFRYGDRQYVLTSRETKHMDLSLNRTLVSVSGVASVVPIKVREGLQPGQTVEWRTLLHVTDV